MTIMTGELVEGGGLMVEGGEGGKLMKKMRKDSRTTMKSYYVCSVEINQWIEPHG